MKTKCTLIVILLVASLPHLLSGQFKLDVAGNGRFFSNSSTNVDILNADDNTNALIRFGDNSVSKASLGFNGNNDAFTISMGTTLGRSDLTMSKFGRIGINTLPTDHRFFIRHNSTSGEAGSAHLTLQESSTSDFSRLRFENDGEDGFWTLASRTTDGSALMNIFYNDGDNNFANLMSFDGDLFRIGIHQQTPNAYLHIKQQNAGLDALKFENDDATGGEIWGWRVGDNDILLYFEGDLRASFNSDDGVYTNFPPPAALAGKREAYDEAVLDDVLQLEPIRYATLRSRQSSITLNPEAVQRINPNWVRQSEDGTRLGIDYQQFTLLAIKSVQEQQELIEHQARQIDRLQAEKEEMKERLIRLERRLQELFPTDTTPGHEQNVQMNEQAQAPSLGQNTPNPFRDETVISLTVPLAATNAVCQITNAQGVVVKTYTLGHGQQELIINRSDLQSGTYFYTLIVDQNIISTRQMVVQ